MNGPSYYHGVQVRSVGYAIPFLRSFFPLPQVTLGCGHGNLTLGGTLSGLGANGLFVGLDHASGSGSMGSGYGSMGSGLMASAVGTVGGGGSAGALPDGVYVLEGHNGGARMRLRGPSASITEALANLVYMPNQYWCVRQRFASLLGFSVGFFSGTCMRFRKQAEAMA